MVDNKRIANHCYQAEHSMKISAALNKRIALHLFILVCLLIVYKPISEALDLLIWRIASMTQYNQLAVIEHRAKNP
ncbi:hypothetical protein UA70_11540 [Raoultella planticola]|nr:hypothetical protein UA70_11540 [Raoultella planticola]